MRATLRYLLLLIACLAPCMGGCTHEFSDADIKEISLGDVRKLVAERKKDRVVLLDARNADDFVREHIADARNLPLTAVSGRKGDIDPSIERFDRLVVYGENPSSALARGVVKRMMASGYDDVFWFKGGLAEWRRAGLPVATAGQGAPGASAPAPGTSSGTGATPRR